MSMKTNALTRGIRRGAYLVMAPNPTFPERIMRMSEETVRTKNKAMLRSSTLESWAVLITSASMSALPWVICFTGVLNGNNAAAVIGGIAGLLASGSSLIQAIRNKKND